MIKYIFILILIFCVNCSSNNKNVENIEKNIETPEELYVRGITLFDKQNYELANNEFSKLQKLFPLTNEAIQAEIMIAFIYYLKMDYSTAEVKFEKIIIKYPSLKNLDYVYYMRAMCNYEQITHHGLDGKFNDVALKNFNQVIDRFPNSKYAQDSRQKIILVKSNQAAKHMEIGRFYLKEKKFTAALNRFKIVIDQYSMTKFTPEALHRMTEAYYEMGMFEESNNIAAVLGHNYPDSKWYKYSYQLIKNIEDKDSFLKKVKNIF